MPRQFDTLDIASPCTGVTVITMNRPEVANALNTQMMMDLRDCFAQFSGDSDSTRCLVLTGAGEDVFCAGADLKERKGMSDEDWGRQHAILEQMIRAIAACPIPIIAAVNGAAYAGGCELALACDFIYAAWHAKFAQTEVTLGIIPGAGGTQNLPKAVGIRRAKEIILAGQPFHADQAAQWGLANRVIPVEDLIEEVLHVADRIAQNAPIAVRQAKMALNKSGDLDAAAGYDFEIEAYNRTVPTDDRREGINAFNEKRTPVFKGQ